jgi:hypothetical protein
MPAEFKAKRWGVNITFTAIAIVLWGLSYYLMFVASGGPGDPNAQATEREKKHFCGELAKDLGVVVVGLTLVNVLWSVFGGDPVEQDVRELRRSVGLIGQLQRCGIIQIAPRPAGQFPWGLDTMDPVDAILKANRSIDMCGFTLHALFSSGRFKENLETALRKKVRIRICIASPENMDVLNFCTPDCRGAMPGQSHGVLSDLMNLKSKLTTEGKALGERLSVFELRSGLMSMSMLRRDGLMIAVPYLRSTFTLDSPAVLLVESGDFPHFDRYQREFDYLLEQSTKLAPPPPPSPPPSGKAAA